MPDGLLHDPLRSGYRWTLLKIDAFFAGPRWQLKLWLTCVLLHVLLTAPFFNFRYFNTPGSHWGVIEQQSAHLLTPVRAIDHSHEAKMAFRLTVPSLGAALGLKAPGLYAVQVLCGLLLIYLLIRLSYQVLNDRVGTALFAVACVPCYFLFTASYDVFGRPDSYPLLFLVAALCWRNPLLIGLFCTLAAWSDERGLISAAFVFAYWVFAEWNRGSGENKLRTWLNGPTLAVVASGILYLVGRWVLIRYFGFRNSTADTGLANTLLNLRYIALATFSSFEALWLVVLVAGGLLASFRQFRLLLVLTACFAVNWLVAISVSDVSRSIAYGFIGLFICLLVLKKYLPVGSTRALLFVGCALALLLPIGCWDGHYHYIPPLPQRLAEVLLMR